MLLIGEVSRISQVSLRMLRYYDKNDLFKPKVINEENGYRYYTADQLDDLYRIVELRDLGFSVAEIGELIKQDDKEQYRLAIKKKQMELEQEILDAQTKLKRLKSLLTDIETDSLAHPEITIVLKTIPNKDVISYRKTVENYFAEGQMWSELTDIMLSNGLKSSVECFSLYHDLDYREENVDIELCVVMELPIEKIPEGLIHRQVIGCEKAASILIKGPYENISAAYRKFATWLEQHPEYKMSGPNRQICHVSALDTDNPQEYVTELLIPLEVI